MTVGEVGGGATPAEANRYAGFKNGSMNMVFNFDHNWHNNVWNMSSIDEEVVVNLVSLKEIFKKWQLGQ
jgi:hypothetical protein